MEDMCKEEVRKQELELQTLMRNQNFPEHEITESLAEYTQMKWGRLNEIFDKWATNHRRRYDSQLKARHLF